ILSLHKKKYGDALRGNIHFFTGDYEIASSYFDLGFSVSFTGVITFTNDYDDVVINSPLNLLMTETDCPYATPTPLRGKRNEPSFVRFITQKIALLKKE